MTHEADQPQSHAEVLIVEDSVTQAARLKQLLLDRGFLVHVAGDGARALEMARERRPDVILSDIAMPVMDGFEMCRCLRDEPVLRDIPVVLLTELQSPEILVQALRAGVSGLLVKPCDEGALADRLRYLLANRKPGRGAEPSVNLSFQYGGTDHTIAAEPGQVMDLLFSVFEAALAQNRKLEQTQAELGDALSAVESLARLLQGEKNARVGDAVPAGAARVLVVEDSPVQAERLKATLEKHQFVVSVARDGQQGLDLARTVRPALILSDIVMPVMDGFEMCRQIKQDAALANTPVVMLTTLSDPLDIVHGMNAGADFYLTKPCDEHSLLHRLRGILAKPRAVPGSGTTEALYVLIGGKRQRVQTSRRQLLDLLLSTYENAVQQNRDLQRLKAEQEAMNANLENLVQKRTAALQAEMAERIRTAATPNR